MILIAVGANLPDSAGRSALETCRWAARQLERLAPIGAVSRWYRTAPVPSSGQPDYINGVVRLDGASDPQALLAELHKIEDTAGRVRAEVNAARVLDLDLLAVDDQVVATSELVLPHPRLAQRAFVLVPLCDVAPGWVHPGLGQSAAALLAGVNRAGVSLACGGAVD